MNATPLEALRLALVEAADTLRRGEAEAAALALEHARDAASAASAAGLSGDTACRELHRECVSLATSLHQQLGTQVREAGLSSRARLAYQRVEASRG